MSEFFPSREQKVDIIEKIKEIDFDRLTSINSLLDFLYKSVVKETEKERTALLDLMRLSLLGQIYMYEIGKCQSDWIDVEKKLF